MMKQYEQVLETVELALSKGEYYFCIEFLSPLINSFPLSSREGVNLRTILITALCGVNKKEDAKKFCEELLKSHDFKTRENAKYLMEIINSPEIKKPENWNIKFENNPALISKSLNSLNLKKNNLDQKKFINVIDRPTGETQPFQKGFTLIIFLILLLLIPLLSGCVKIENTLDITSPDSINNYLTVESKYINKFPWQIKFEEAMKDSFPGAEILMEESKFILINKNLKLANTEEVLKKIQYTAGDLAGLSSDLEINTSEKNLLFFKKYFYRITIDLRTISEDNDLELNFKIIHPNKAAIKTLNKNQFKLSKNLIDWKLIPGQINTLEFSFWSWNILIIGMILISILIVITYLLRFFRFKLGTDLPQLPSE